MTYRSVVSLLQPFPMLPGRRAQVWRHQDAYLRPRHFHDEPEINLVLAGSALLGIGQQQVRLTAGDAVYLAPGQDHVLLEADPELELFVFALQPELAAAVGSDRARGGATIAVPDVLLRSTAETLYALAEVTDHSVHEARLGDLFRDLLSAAPAIGATSRRALGRLALDPGSSEGALAQSLRTQTSELSRSFHRDVGVRLVEYRARLRLMRFIAHADAGRTLTQAALAADFGSYAQCHRVFQRNLGCSPSAYFGGTRHVLDAATSSRAGC